MRSNNLTRIIGVMSQKGGVGKTTSVMNIGDGLFRRGRKVLLIDLDPQAHLTTALGFAPPFYKTIYDVLDDQAPVQDAILNRNGLHLLPSEHQLANAESELPKISKYQYTLKNKMAAVVHNYDYIIVDCTPSLGSLFINAFVFVNEVFIPVQVEWLAIKGVATILNVFEAGKKYGLNDDLEVTGVIATMYDGRKILNREMINHINELFGNKVFKTFIRDNVSLAESPSLGQTIFEYLYNCYGSQDYRSLVSEILKMEDNLREKEHEKASYHSFFSAFESEEK
ncbi:MAG: ParA family protein [Candidatus Marinimicrobia bacterium]|nr:ParA family protein [Candidatus Neomarinimicrobiota bacterium]